MTVYAYPNFKSKKELKEAAAKNQPINLEDQSFIAPKDYSTFTGKTCICGPHYPKPHTWYAEVHMQDGKIVKIK